MVAKYGSINHNVEEKDNDNSDNEENASENCTRRAALFNYKYILGKHSTEDVSFVKLTYFI